MRKSQEVTMILEAIMSEGVMVDDRIRKAVKRAVKEIRDEKFREKRMLEREEYQEKMRKERRKKKCTSGSKKSR